MFVNDKAIEAEFRQYAEKNHSEMPESIREDWIKSNVDDNHKGRRKWQVFLANWKFYQNLLPKDELRLLDLGCGSGSISFNALAAGYPVYGLEPGYTKIEFVGKKHAYYSRTNQILTRYPPFVRGFGEEIPFKDNTFSAIFTSQVLEHVRDTKTVLGECIRVLKPGGFFFVEIPNYFSFYEGHYNIFWLPLFPRRLAKIYLRLRGRNTNDLDLIIYTTKRKMLQELRGEGVMVFDPFLMKLYDNLEHPSQIVNSTKRTIYRLAKLLGLTEALAAWERFLHLFHLQLQLFVIKKPSDCKNTRISKVRIL